MWTTRRSPRSVLLSEVPAFCILLLGVLDLDTQAYVEGFVEGCLERISEDDPDEEDFLRGVWEDGDDRGFVLEALKSGVDVRAGRPQS